MASTVHYISVSVPGAGSQLKAGGSGGNGTGSGTQNINDGVLTSTSPSTDPVGIFWTDTGVLATRVTKKQLLMALKTMISFIERGGYRTSGAAGQDPHVPV